MKVGYVAPMSISVVNGGLRNQAKNTIQHVKKFGVEPVLLSPWKILNKQDLDLIHVFGSSIENEGIIDQINKKGIPYILSPVFYSNRSASFISSSLKLERLLGKKFRTDFSLKAGQCQKANLILPNTSDEAMLIQKGFSIPENKIRIIPNGVEERFATVSPDLFHEQFGIRDFVLFVGQAGAERKNVIKLLETAPKIDAPVVIIGSFYEDAYSKKCLNLASKATNVHLIDTMDHESYMLASAYAACKVFVLPSLFETPGIAAMEAALAGANIVITKKGGTRDYFKEHAEYISPSAGSLLNGITKALAKSPSDHLKDLILENFSWEKVANKTVQQYKELLQ
ncbi:MAG: glycosyltransferase family 4 protein [Gracilimonas sp.]